MSDVTRKDGGAMDTINCLPDNQYEWEWPADFIPIGLAALWIWRTHLTNKKQRLQSGELVRKSRN
ncbi:hypothetical protein V2O64_17495 [Verrucomicrobiaceae bacterium 227]